MSPILKEVKDELGEAAIILKVDVDKNQALAVKYNVRGVPTLILFQKKQIVWQQSGVVTKIDIVAKIKEHFE
jgi:thioredoxin 1